MRPIHKYKTWLQVVGFGASTALTVRLLFQDSLSPVFFRELHAKSNADSAGAQDADKLVSVHMFSRHGARTPLFMISGLEQAKYDPSLMDPYVKAKYVLRSLDNRHFEECLSFYDKTNCSRPMENGVPRGFLTKIGEQQMFNLGRRIRKKYIEELKFLSPSYNTEQFYTRSSHYKRTINSAKSVLAGVFAESPNVETNEPYVIHVHDHDEDYLFPNSLGCKLYAEINRFFRKLSLFTRNQEYIAEFKKLTKEVEVYHAENCDRINFTFFRDDLSAREVHGLPVPEHLKELFAKSHKYATMELSALARQNIQVSCGQLLNMIRQNLCITSERHHDGKSVERHRFRYYSAHDSTLNALLIALDLEHKNHLWPPFGADLIIELWSKGSQANASAAKARSNYFIKIFYCGEPVEHYHQGEQRYIWTLTEFMKLLEKNSVDKATYEKLCNQSLNLDEL